MLNGVKSAAGAVRQGLRMLKSIYTGKKHGSLSHEEIVELIGMPDPVIFEVGCNNGADTIEFLDRFPLAQIYCFEPDPRAIRRFKDNVSDPTGRVRLFEMALGDIEGRIDFYQSNGEKNGLEEGWDGSGSIRAPNKELLNETFPFLEFDRVINVRISTIDQICFENGIEKIDFLWMDVQGAEGDVLRGAVRMLDNIRFIYTEYADEELYEGQLSLKQIIELLPNFEIDTLYKSDVLLRRKSP